MAKILNDVSRTFNEFLLLPNLTDERCIPSNVSLKTPLLNFTSGVRSDTFDGMHFSVVKFGNNKNSLNVLDMSGNIVAIFNSSLFSKKNCYFS